METAYIEYGEQRTSDLSLRFAPGQEFRNVVDVIRSVRLPSVAVNAELAAFSVLELLSNSIRAHREHKVSEEVSLKFSVRADVLEIEVLDAGRGFDPTKLPYRLEDPPERVNPTSLRFTEYRLEHANGRFGMGLLAARKTFPGFSLTFVDKALRPCPWYSGLVRGTRITLSAPLASEPREIFEDFEELPLAEEEA